jgi:hypothetical protein
VFRSRLEAIGAEIPVQLRVEDVEPHDRLRAFVDVLVPGPARREHEITDGHRTRFAVDDRRGALAVEDEADRVHRVPVRSGGLTRREDLQTGVEVHDRGGGAGLARLGIDQREDAPFGDVHPAQLERAADQARHRAPRPVVRPVFRRLPAVRDHALPQR